ncbi:MAG: SPOR domain-containing protein [Nitriliruptoraceae bacterium]
MAAASSPTMVGSFASQQDAEVARERLEGAGISPVTIEQVDQDVWLVHAPVESRTEALAELQLLEQRRRGPAI